jgi:hypothetical protein
MPGLLSMSGGTLLRIVGGEGWLACNGFPNRRVPHPTVILEGMRLQPEYGDRIVFDCRKLFVTDCDIKWTYRRLLGVHFPLLKELWLDDPPGEFLPQMIPYASRIYLTTPCSKIGPIHHTDRMKLNFVSPADFRAEIGQYDPHHLHL